MTTAQSLACVPDLDSLVKLVEEQPNLFLRYSKGPDHDAREGPSMDYESGVTMPGLSVTTIGPEPWWPRPAVDWIARRVCKYAELGEEDGRRPWLLTGRVVGYGPDHEPLVDRINPLAWLAPEVLDAAQRRYHAVFDVGRDSRGSASGSAASNGQER